MIRSRRLLELTKKHPEIEHWAVGAAGLLRALLSLCEAKVAAWQLQAERHMRQYQELKWTQQTAGDNCREHHQRMKKQIAALTSTMTAELKTLVQWEEQRLGYLLTTQQQQQQPPAAPTGEP